MRRLKILLLIIVSGLILHGPALAQETKTETTEIGEIIVTATRSEKSLKDAPGAVTVITQKEIAGKNAIDLAKTLEDTLGLRVLHYGALGANTSVHIRGLYSQHNLIMVDDRVINSPSSSGTELSWLSADNVERIEIVRGASSALYGGNAVSGVINIITKNPPEKLTSSLNTLYGSYQTNITRLSVGATQNKLGFLFTGNYKGSQGHRAHSSLHSNDSHLKFTYDWDDHIKLLVDIGSYQGKSESPGARPAKDPTLRTVSQTTFGDNRVSTHRDYAEKNKFYFHTVLKLNRFKIKTNLNSWNDTNHREWIFAGDHFVEDSNFQTSTYSSEIISNWDLAEKNRLTVGTTAEHHRFKNSQDETNITDRTDNSPPTWKARRGNYATFLQNETDLENDMLLTLGGRWDNPTDFDSQFSGKANLLWHLNPNSTLRVSYGDSYRAPSLNDLNWPRDDSAEGNPDLTPEKGHNYEVGLQHSFDGLELATEANLFRQRVKNMIIWTPTGTLGPWGNRWTPSNVNQAWITGLELKNTFSPFDNISFNLNYILLNARQRNKELRNSATNFMVSETRKLSYMPSHKIDAGLKFTDFASIKDFIFNLGIQYNSATYQYYAIYAAFPDTSVTTQEKKMAGYWLVNLKLSKNVKDMNFSLGVENLLNKQYTTQAGSSITDRGYPMPGRMVMVNCEMKY